MADPRRRSLLTAAACSVLLVCAILLTGTASLAGPARAAVTVPAAGAEEPDCGSALVTRTLPTGSAWRMCARIHPFKGLVLEDVQFRSATGAGEDEGWLRIIGSLYLAQLNVPYDTGTDVFDDITEVGFGDDHLLTQTPETCDGDALPVEQSFMIGSQMVERTIPGICVREAETGLGWHSQEGWATSSDRYVQQGRALEISSLSKAGWYEYQQKVTLTDQGTITVGLGAAGDLAPGEGFFRTDPAFGWPIGPSEDEDSDRHAGSHWHNAIYRVDFAIGTGDQQVEQWDYEGDPALPTRVRGEGTIRDEAFIAENPPATTWWRVVNPGALNADGHPRSYEIVNDAIQNPYLPLTRPPLSFTNDHPCQEYASSNLNAGCPGQSVLDYVASETEPLTDPVAWVSVGYHHIPRDEDQSPMPVHWQSFSLVPRDLLAQQALTPPERACDNGITTGFGGSCAAINVAVPAIAAGDSAPGAGTLLTADSGTWRRARDLLAYQWLWLRDGEPILTTGDDGLSTAATGETYRLTDADLGREITVRVTASATGVTPGIATSAPFVAPLPTPPSAGATRTAPELKLKLLKKRDKKGRPRLRVLVRGDQGAGAGVVTIQRRGKVVTATLTDGRAVVRLPRPGKRYRVTVTYPGDQRYLAASASIRVRR
ncbi:hypothetical protein RB608_08460 [Nocardioides sp. LHD-245]|uniref:copper amine oxidase n=1 Tax=Nocardioides sp. LHD-245 TaxID=3051387 RepID=UPI0027E016E4|nr:hypothetical protein [Nocardioides sp. LHD-245]